MMALVLILALAIGVLAAYAVHLYYRLRARQQWLSDAERDMREYRSEPPPR